MKILAGVTLVGLIGLATVDAGADVVAIQIELLASEKFTCVAKVDEGTKKVYRSKRDVVVWNVSSTCTNPHRVRLCVNGGKPLRKCSGDPESANVGKKFTIAGGTPKKPAHATVACHIKWSVLDERNRAKNYPIEVVYGAANENLKCSKPCNKQKESCPVGSELALEVDP